MGSGRFEGDRKAAWVGHAARAGATMQQLGQELDDAGKIPLSAPTTSWCSSPRTVACCACASWSTGSCSPSPGLSRKVARLEEEGLVERLPDPHDGRGVLVKLTRSGRAALRSAAVVHIAGVERDVHRPDLRRGGGQVLARVFARLLERTQGRATDGSGSGHPDRQRQHERRRPRGRTSRRTPCRGRPARRSPARTAPPAATRPAASRRPARRCPGASGRRRSATARTPRWPARW